MSSSDFSKSRTRNYADGPPWIFTGRALYQLHLVKAETARRVIPPELKLVQAFGFTLGGLYLAHYDSSPAGVFDELVVLAGIVWNPPTSCAWAARVLVNSNEACNHGIEEVGLPSRTADFSLKTCADKRNHQRPWWKIFPKFGAHDQGTQSSIGVDIMETDGSLRRPLCHIELLNKTVMGAEGKEWLGPSIQMSLPSFSGKTKQQPNLLQYSCNLNCRVRPVAPARVSLLQTTTESEAESCKAPDSNSDVLTVLMGKPLMAIAFERMVMHVDAPTVVIPKASRKPEEARGSLYTPQESRIPSLPAESS